jgi:hypothetical protein
MSANWSYRQNLIKNADKIIKLNQSCACTEVPVFPQNTKSSDTPFLYTSCTQTVKPIGYENSDLKEMFLSKQQFQCNMIAPEIHYK